MFKKLVIISVSTLLAWSTNTSFVSGSAFFCTSSRRPCRNETALHVIRGGGNKLFTRKNLFQTIAGTILSTPLALESYARCGKIHTATGIFHSQTNSNDHQRRITSDLWKVGTKDVTIIFHGAGGQDINTDALLHVLKDRCRKGGESLVKMVDWSQDSGNILQASVKGLKIGTLLGRELKDVMAASEENSSVETIHVIGISVGSFPASAMVQELHKTIDPSIRQNLWIQLTLLDPFQQKAVLGLNYGKSNFGKGADYAQQYLNTDDPVPSTNEPLPHCATIDVTSLRPQDTFGHDWPLIYYTNELSQTDSKQTNGFGIVPRNKRRKIGEVAFL